MQKKSSLNYMTMAANQTVRLKLELAQSAGAVEYTDCFSAEG